MLVIQAHGHSAPPPKSTKQKLSSECAQSAHLLAFHPAHDFDHTSLKNNEQKDRHVRDIICLTHSNTYRISHVAAAIFKASHHTISEKDDR
jgi:hypothetical protein